MFVIDPYDPAKAKQEPIEDELEYGFPIQNIYPERYEMEDLEMIDVDSLPFDEPELEFYLLHTSLNEDDYEEL